MENFRHHEMCPPENAAMLLPAKEAEGNITTVAPNSYTARQSSPSKHYRPLSTATGTLIAFLLALAGCLAYLEVVRVSQRALSDYVPLSRRSVEFHVTQRQVAAITTASFITTAPGDPPPSSFLSLASISLSSSASVFAPTGTGDPAPSQELSLTSVSPSPTPTEPPDGDPTSSQELSLTTVTPSPTPTTTLSGDPYIGNELKLSDGFVKADYFLAMYLPTLLTVILQSMWTIIFAATKMMEPFYQLAKPGGARAEDSLLADYLSSGLSMDSLQSLFKEHSVMLCVSVVQVLMGLVVTLAGESMTVEPTAYDPVHHEPASPEWYVNTPALRALQALMSVVFVIVFIIIVLNWKRRSPVVSDPSTIASMAGFLTHSSLVEDLRNIPAAATKKEVKQALAGNQYMLSRFQDGFGQQQYGVVKVVPSGQPTATGYSAVPNPATTQNSSGRSYYRVVRDIVFLLVILALFGIILAYKNIHGNQPLNIFLNSNSFGPRFVLSGVAVLINSGWKRLEREVRITEPYRQMARCLSPADTTVLASMTPSPFTTIFIAARRGWYFVSFIAIVTVSSELLLIAIPGVPFSTAQIRPAYLASSYTSLVILAIMAVAVALVLIRRRRDPDMPREPDTLALVWLYLCASQMSKEAGHEERHRSKMYWFGPSVGVDGKRRWMVDEDQHGIAMRRDESSVEY